MKRAKNLIPAIVALDNLYLAFWKARKGKEHRPEVYAFCQNFGENIRKLQNQIQNAWVDIGNYHYFTIYDPKERIICAAAFHERVLHHALMNVCHPVFENYQIYDSYATRLGKGTYSALDRAIYFQNKYAYFLKMDIRKYFDSIDHNVLLTLLNKRFKDKKLLSIFQQIIQSYSVSAGRGVPIGNLTSQYFANFYLAFADRYLKEKIGINGYVRYMDDMILWSNNKKELLQKGRQFEKYLNVYLTLDLKVNFLNKNKQGLSFLGYRIFPNFVLLNKRSKARFKRKLKLYDYNWKYGYWTEEQYQRHLMPLFAFTEYANSYGFRKNVLKSIGE